MKNNLLEIKNLSIDFGDSKNKVLNNFYLELKEGDKFALIGESGSGKSVMILSIIGLLEGANIKGEIIFNSMDLLKLSNKELNEIRGRKIAYIPQGGGNSLNPLIKVGNQIGEPLVIHRNYKKKDAMDFAIEIMKKFNLGDEKNRLNNYPHTFSGGMKQRAMIGMGISAGAELLLTDEPTKGLDPERIELVVDSFNRLKDKSYITITHDLIFAKNISNRVGVLHSSFLIEEGNTDEIFNNPLHPYTEDLINALPENGLKINNLMFYEKSDENQCRYYKNCKYKTDICLNSPPMVNIDSRKVRCWKYA